MKKVISIIVCLIILLCMGLFVFRNKEEFSYNENRYLTKMPEFKLDDILSGKYMAKMNDYISDHFPFREELLNIKSRVFRLLGNYKQNDVYYGSDGYLFQEYVKPSNSDLIIKKVNDFVNKIDVDSSFMLVPTSIYINSDKIAKYNQTYDEGEIIDYFKDNLLVDLVDVRSSFINNKEDYLFYKTDHHWTSRGAYLAYLEYCKSIGIDSNNFLFDIVNDNFYGTLYSKVVDNSLEYDYIEKIRDDTEYLVNYVDDNKYSDSLYNDSYLDKKDKYSYFLDNNHSLIEIDNLDNNSGENLLIIKDSYANSIIPMISIHYDNVYVIDPRYYLGSISEYIDSNDIDRVLFIYNVLTIDSDLGIVSIR